MDGRSFAGVYFYCLFLDRILAGLTNWDFDNLESTLTRKSQKYEINGMRESEKMKFEMTTDDVIKVF